MRDKVSPEERGRFQSFLTRAINKLDSEKNRKKDHWETASIAELDLMLDVEKKELSLAIFAGLDEAIRQECYDIINLAMMILDNVRGER